MRLLPALCLSLAAALPAAADPVVVELYTSQGCSSCPPADDLLGQLAGRDEVIALSMHVDYWDWIGWKDTFANPAFSDRQRQYAAAAGSSVVYTPQFVIGGTDQIAGANGMAIAEMVRSRAEAMGDVLEIEGDDVVLSATGRPALLVFVEVEPKAQVTILHGENAGREITYHHIVRAWTPLAEWDGAGGKVPLPAASDAGLYRVVLAQESDGRGYPGAIVGAAMAR